VFNVGVWTTGKLYSWFSGFVKTFSTLGTSRVSNAVVANVSKCLSVVMHNRDKSEGESEPVSSSSCVVL